MGRGAGEAVRSSRLSCREEEASTWGIRDGTYHPEAVILIMNGHEYNIGIDLEKSCNTSTYFEDYTLKQNGKVQDK